MYNDSLFAFKDLLLFLPFRICFLFFFKACYCCASGGHYYPCYSMRTWLTNIIIMFILKTVICDGLILKEKLYHKMKGKQYLPFYLHFYLDILSIYLTFFLSNCFSIYLIYLSTYLSIYIRSL